MSVLTTMLEGAINRALRLDPDALRRLAELNGKVILLELAQAGSPVRLYVLPSEAGVLLRDAHDAVPDVTISGTLSIFLRQFQRGPTVSGELIVRGDIELGQRFQRVLASARPDWEEGLAQAIGDVPAHQLGRAARALREWGEQALRTLGADAAEYMKEEALIAAKPERVQQFLREVDRLRADTDRLEKRIQRLHAP
jgi:ubiquinone biosynthesis accessory factor UbiJ